jgi:hypothetical protein
MDSPSNDNAFHRNSSARLHENDLANSDLVRFYVLPGFVSAYRSGRGQQTDQMADCVAAATDCESFEDLGHENKKGNYQGREDFADRQSSHDSDGHVGNVTERALRSTEAISEDLVNNIAHGVRW